MNFLIKYHEQVRNIVYTIAVIIAGVWLASDWLFDNWAGQYFTNPMAQMSVNVRNTGVTKSGHRFIQVEITAKSVNSRGFFVYANAITVRSVQFSKTGEDGFDLKLVDNHINDPKNIEGTWVLESAFKRDESNVVAYSQFMPQGYAFRPYEQFRTVKTIFLPENIVLLNIEARIAYGASSSLFNANATISGGLTVDGNGTLTACFASPQPEKPYQTTCEKDASDRFEFRESYAVNSYVLVNN